MTPLERWETAMRIDNLGQLCDELAGSARRQHRRRLRTTAATIAVGFLATAGAMTGLAVAEANKTPVTPATEFHGLPGNNPGHSNEQQGAAPAQAGGDGGMHNIAGVHANGTGQPNGTPPACTAHGGLDAVNPNC